MAKAVGNALRAVVTFIVVAAVASVVGIPFQAFSATFGTLVTAASVSLVFASTLF